MTDRFTFSTNAGQDDVQGFAEAHPISFVFGLGTAIGYYAVKSIEGSGSGSGPTTGQMIQGWVDQANGARARALAGR